MEVFTVIESGIEICKSSTVKITVLFSAGNRFNGLIVHYSPSSLIS